MQYVVRIEILSTLLTINERAFSSKSRSMSIFRNDEDELPIVPSAPIDRVTKWTSSYLFCSSKTNFLYFVFFLSKFEERLDSANSQFKNVEMI